MIAMLVPAFADAASSWGTVPSWTSPTNVTPAYTYANGERVRVLRLPATVGQWGTAPIGTGTTYPTNPYPVYNPGGTVQYIPTQYGNPYPVYPAGATNIFIVTEQASAITRNSARIAGTVNGFQPGTVVWFEYGTSQNLSAQTVPQNASGVYFNAPITNLVPNTTYFYRAVGQLGPNVSRGEIRSFATLAVTGTVLGSSTTGTTRVAVTKTVQNVTSPNGTTTLVAAMTGDTLRYTITLRNVGTRLVSGVIVTDVIPAGLTVKNIPPKAVYEEETNTVRITTGSISASETAIYTIDVVVAESASGIVVNTARAVGEGIATKTSNETQVVISTRPCDEKEATSGVGNTTSASVANSLLPNGFFGWLMFLILFVIVIAILVAVLRRKKQTVVVNH
jgi:uncharacterized repeat protein (TIGR01451 family)